MLYKILHHRLFEKEILRVPNRHQQKIYRLLKHLSENPQKLLPNTTPLSGYDNLYRTRFGDLRLIYHLNHRKKMIFVLGVSPRGNVYKLIKRMLS